MTDISNLRAALPQSVRDAVVTIATYVDSSRAAPATASAADHANQSIGELVAALNRITA